MLFQATLTCKLTRPINCSLYHKGKPKRVLIYLHSISGSRMEGKDMAYYVLPHFSLLVFDFVGCGLSEGKNVTLGIKEAEDLKLVVNTLIQIYKTEEIYLWGRSMGAVTAIHYLHYLDKVRKDIDFKYKQLRKLHNYRKSLSQAKPIVEKNIKQGMKQVSVLKLSCKASYYIKGVVLDSCFANANNLVKGIIKRVIGKSELLSDLTLFYLTNNIKNNIGVDVLSKNIPIKKVPEISVPGLFMIGDGDDMVDSKSFNDMFQQYGSDQKKLRILVETDHVDCRNDVDIEFGVKFLKKLSETTKQEKPDMSIDLKYAEEEEEIMRSFIQKPSKVIKRRRGLSDNSKMIK